MYDMRRRSADVIITKTEGFYFASIGDKFIGKSLDSTCRINRYAFFDVIKFGGKKRTTFLNVNKVNYS